MYGIESARSAETSPISQKLHDPYMKSYLLAIPWHIWHSQLYFIKKIQTMEVYIGHKLKRPTRRSNAHQTRVCRTWAAWWGTPLSSQWSSPDRRSNVCRLKHLRHPPLPAGPLVRGGTVVTEHLLLPRQRRVSFLQHPADLPFFSLLTKCKHEMNFCPSFFSICICNTWLKLIQIQTLTRRQPRMESSYKIKGRSWTVNRLKIN